MKKTSLSAKLLTTFVISILLLISSFAFVTVQGQTRTEVTGIISSNTMWTKTNSPYWLTGPVAVINGVTLTIEAGVTVQDVNSAYIQVNGTLRARGSAVDPIHFILANITFMPSSSSWNEQTGSGCIIENAVVGELIIVKNASPKIISNFIEGVRIEGGSPVITNNDIYNDMAYGYDQTPYNNHMGLTITAGSPNVFKNNITGIIIDAGSPIISNNNLTRGSNGNVAVVNVNGGLPVISGNTIISGVYSWQNGPYRGSEVYPGIIANGGNISVSDNVIFNCSLGIVAKAGTFERNLIVNNTDAFTQGAGLELSQGIIRNNTISGNLIGVKLSSSSSVTINNNNILDNFWYNLYLENTAINVDAGGNWWGTTNQSAINQTIRDFKNDFNLGKVTFTPFLSATNPQAMPNPTATQPPVIPETFPTWTILALLIMATLAVAATTKAKCKQRMQRQSQSRLD